MKAVDPARRARAAGAAKSRTPSDLASRRQKVARAPSWGGTRARPARGAGRALARSGIAAAASLSSTSCAVSRGPIATLSTSATGPASSSRTILMSVIPVSRSPEATADWMGEAPRYLGSSDAWRLSVPRRGHRDELVAQDVAVGDDERQVGPQGRQRGERAGVELLAAASPRRAGRPPTPRPRWASLPGPGPTAGPGR